MTSKQTKASEQWAHAAHMTKIDALCAQATNYMYPAGQAQAGLQMALVEIPYLLQEIERLKVELNERHQAAA